MTDAMTEPTLDELRARVRAISPEVLAGDGDATAELAELERAINDHERRIELERLAAEEQDERARLAAERDRERQLGEWAEQKAAAEAARQDALVKVERALDALVAAITDAHEHDSTAERLGRQIDPGYNHRRWRALIEDRIAFRLHGVGIRDLHAIAPLGRDPLAQATRCLVCEHEQADEIKKAVDAGEPLRAIAERFGVSPSSLSRHGKHRR